MTQLALLAPEPDAPAPTPPTTCPRCGGKLKRARCHPCQKDTPPIGGPAWKRWTHGICRIMWSRLGVADLDAHGYRTLLSVLGDDPAPAETEALVADLLALPCSPRRYHRRIETAELRAKIGYRLAEQGLRGTDADPYAVDNIAGRAADLIWAQRDRVAAGEIFKRQHEAELVEQALLEHEAREQLRADGWKGPKLEAEVARVVEIAMRAVRGSYGRPSDEYPRAARIAVGLPRVATATVRIDADEHAVIEAAEDEAAELQRGRVA